MYIQSKKNLLILIVFAFTPCGGQGQKKYAAVENDYAVADVTVGIVATSDVGGNNDDQRYEMRKIDSLEAANSNMSHPIKSYLIKEGGIDMFLIGHAIPTQADGYLITKSMETRWEEGDEFTVPVYTISEEGQNVLKIEPFYDYNTGLYSEEIGDIYILSDKFKTVENIGLKSTIEEFVAAYPDFEIWFSYVSDRYVIETKRLANIQFLLDGSDFIEEGGPKFESDMTILQPSEFKKGSKIKAIRIYGFPET